MVVTFKNKVLSPAGMLLIGAILGILSKLFDIHTEILGNMFSEFPIWILLGTLISIYSDTKRKAAWNMFTFCVGMLLTYYITAEITDSVYGYAYVQGWAVFACLCPVLAYFTWIAKEKGIIPAIIRFGIIGVSLFCSLFLFSLDIFDIMINAVLIYFLLIKKIDRTAL